VIHTACDECVVAQVGRVSRRVRGGAASSQITDTKASAPRSLDTTAPVLWQPSMNVFRRFAAPKEKMFEFYGTVLGFRQLTSLNVNASGGGVADPDGVTNYYAETAASRAERAPSQ
jgi:hypothetical protein